MARSQISLSPKPLINLLKNQTSHENITFKKSRRLDVNEPKILNARFVVKKNVKKYVPKTHEYCRKDVLLKLLFGSFGV